MKKLTRTKKIIIISLLTIIVSTVSSTYSFLNLYIKMKNKPEAINYTAYLFAEYNSDSYIDNDNVLSGFKEELEFSIVNMTMDENVVGEYEINWDISYNNIFDNNLVYSITGECYKNNQIINPDEYNTLVIKEKRPLPSVSSSIGIGKINSGIRQKYKVTVEYLNNKTQNTNILKHFSGKISVKNNNEKIVVQ